MADRRHPSDPAPVPIPTGLAPSGQLVAKIRGVLFDLYGTLFISASGDIGMTRTAGAPPQGLGQLLARFDLHRCPEGLQRDFLAAIDSRHRRLKAGGIDFPEVEIDRIWMTVLDTADRAAARTFARAYEALVNPVHPMPHLRRLLAFCRTAKLVMGIISNAQFYTPELFTRFLGSDLRQLGFDPGLTILSYRLGHAKPSPILFRQAVKRLGAIGIDPGEVLYVGNDRLNDIWPAAAAGFNTALFAGDARSLRLRAADPRCKDVQPDLIITGLDQLLDLLDPKADRTIDPNQEKPK